ncbi:MAG TPA: MBL fold metallo-hydrolase [Terriglobales bacterium]|nr:MBL fold metallo-hydrolase [Terriglobales bacterium]
MQRANLGDFELISVPDGLYRLDGGAFFGIVPKSMWSKKVQADENNLVPVGLNSIVVRTGEQTILIETGIGNKLSEKMQKIYGQPAKLLEDLAAAGVSPEEIDIVINSHLHFDHCGWNTARQGGKVVATFPRAKYYAPEGEWMHGHKPLERDAISYIGENYDPLVESGQMKLLRGDQEIVPGVSVKVFPGHTETMQAIILQSGGRTACYISDLIPTTAHLDLTWGMAFDLFPVQTIESKKKYYARAIPEKWLTMFTHDPNTPWAYVEKDEKGKMVTRGM